MIHRPLFASVVLLLCLGGTANADGSASPWRWACAVDTMDNSKTCLVSARRAGPGGVWDLGFETDPLGRVALRLEAPVTVQTVAVRVDAGPPRAVPQCFATTCIGPDFRPVQRAALSGKRLNLRADGATLTFDLTGFAKAHGAMVRDWGKQER